jgi:hypothetical protein
VSWGAQDSGTNRVGANALTPSVCARFPSELEELFLQTPTLSPLTTSVSHTSHNAEEVSPTPAEAN